MHTARLQLDAQPIAETVSQRRRRGGAAFGIERAHATDMSGEISRPDEIGERRLEQRRRRRRERACAPCKGPAMPDGRCRMHGGTSTSPRTPEGLQRIVNARLVHGAYGAEMRELHRLMRIPERSSGI
jgi:hypothetical protein